MEDTSQQEMFRKDLIAKGYGEATFGDEVLGALDHGADVVSAIAAPIMSAGQTVVDYVTGVPVEEMQRSQATREEALDYTPRTKIGQEYSDAGKEVMANGAQAFMGFVKDPDNAWMFGYMPEGIAAVTEMWNKIPEDTRMAIGAGGEIGALLTAGALTTAKTASKVNIPEVDAPTTDQGIPNIDTTPEVVTEPALLKGSTPRLTESRPTPTANVDELGYTSGIEEGIIKLIKDPKTPNTVNAAQLMGLLKKGGGVKDDEIEWSTFSDYIDTLGKKQIPLDEALRQAKNRSITLEVVPFHIADGRPKFSGYVTKGGSNYQELLFKFNTDKEGLKESIDGLATERLMLEEENRKLGTRRQEIIQPRVKAMEFQNRRLYRELDNNPPEPEEGVFDSVTGAMLSNGIMKVGGSGPDGRVMDREELDWELDMAADMELDPSTRQVTVQQRLREIREELVDKNNRLRDSIFDRDHWPDHDNTIFHARLTDREIGGGNSLSIDEVQSDWHQGKGIRKNRPYYRLSEEKLKPHIEEQITQSEVAYKNADEAYNSKDAEVRKISKEFGDIQFGDAEDSLLDDRRDLYLKKEKALKELNNHSEQLSLLKTVGYKDYVRELRANAPLKNKDKWMGAALNALLYKAVKEGYDSVSWPNGKTQSKLYEGHLEAGQIEALEKMYDVTVPTMLSKMAKKLDKNARLEFGKKSIDSNPYPRVGSSELGEAEWLDRLNGGTIQGGDLVDEWGEVVERNVNRADFNKEYGFGEGYDEINSAFSHIKITPTMKAAILKGKPLFNKGGLVENEMSSMGFAEGGLPKRTVPLGDSTNPSDGLGDVEFRADLDPAMSFNPLARLGYDPKKGKVMGTEEDIAYATNPYFDKYPDRELQDSMDKSVDKDNAVAKYFREGAKRSEVDASLLEDGYSQEQLDAKGIQGGDVVLSPAMAKGAGVWSHEYTHKGLEILSNRLGDDIESHLQFRKAYGEDAYDLLLALREDMGNDASEYISELFDTDTKGPYSKEESQSTDAYRSSDQLQNDLKYGGDSYENTEGSTGVKGLVRAAQDLLISEGEPDTSMRDEMKSLFN